MVTASSCYDFCNMMLATSNSLGTLAELCDANFEKSNLNNIFIPSPPNLFTQNSGCQWTKKGQVRAMKRDGMKKGKRCREKIIKANT